MTITVNVLKTGLLAWSKETLKCVHLTETPSVKTIDTQTLKNLSVNFSVVNLAHIAEGHSQEKDVSPVVNCYLCRSIVFCQTCNQCPNCCTRSTSRGKTTEFLENFGSSGCRSESNENSKTRLHPPLSDPIELDKITDCH